MKSPQTIYSYLGNKKYILKREIINLISVVKSISRQKIFCIGLNKTGTTSLKTALDDLGFIVGNQRKAELFVSAWAKRNFRPIIHFCRTAQAFQDVPFSLPYTYQALDMAFPNSKFILSIRDDSEQWYRSLTNFHAKIWGNGKIPDKKVLQNANYVYKGFPWESFRLAYTTSEDDLYNKAYFIQYYENYNNTIMDYFRHREKDLLVINVSRKNSYNKLCKFLNVNPLYEKFPLCNKT